MNIILSSSNSQPIYEQIVTQIKAMIMSGELKPKDPLPSIRGLAKSLHVSVITAQHAYEELQRDGFIETVAGKGTFVAAQNQDFIREEHLRIAEKKLMEVANIGKDIWRGPVLFWKRERSWKASGLYSWSLPLLK